MSPQQATRMNLPLSVFLEDQRRRLNRLDPPIQRPYVAHAPPARPAKPRHRVTQPRVLCASCGQRPREYGISRCTTCKTAKWMQVTAKRAETRRFFKSYRQLTGACYS